MEVLGTESESFRRAAGALNHTYKEARGQGQTWFVMVQRLDNNRP